MQNVKIKFIIFFTEKEKLDSEIVGFKVILASGKLEHEKEFGTRTAQNHSDKPHQHAIPIDFEICKLKKFTNDKAIRLTGVILYDKKGNERVRIGQTKHSDEMIDTVGS